MKAHFSFFGWLFNGRKSAVTFTNTTIQPKGVYKGSVVWQHFVKGKSRFSEIILKRN
jgi:hypothetical protein